MIWREHFDTQDSTEPSTNSLRHQVPLPFVLLLIGTGSLINHRPGIRLSTR